MLNNFVDRAERHDLKSRFLLFILLFFHLVILSHAFLLDHFVIVKYWLLTFQALCLDFLLPAEPFLNIIILKIHFLKILLLISLQISFGLCLLCLHESFFHQGQKHFQILLGVYAFLPHGWTSLYDCFELRFPFYNPNVTYEKTEIF